MHGDVDPYVLRAHVEKRHHKSAGQHDGQALEAVVHHAEDQPREEDRRPVPPAAQNRRHNAAERKFLRDGRDQNDCKQHRDQLRRRGHGVPLGIHGAVQAETLEQHGEQVRRNIHHKAEENAGQHEQNAVYGAGLFDENRIAEAVPARRKKHRKRQRD